jgi:hypothetical protein
MRRRRRSRPTSGHAGTQASISKKGSGTTIAHWPSPTFAPALPDALFASM